LALLHRYKNSRAGSNLAPIFGLLDEAQQREAEVLGKAMRFGAMFSVNSPEDAGELALLRNPTRLQLTLSKRGEGLYGEVAEARFLSLAASMGAKPVVIKR
ncbi:MAG: exopolyphosphatase, partial [Phaeovulum sp.]|nr:exopolyphosphatase [Phaeovulum sp.]